MTDSLQIVPVTMEHFQQVLKDHARYWGERDLRALHLPALVQEFPLTSQAALAEDGIRGYILGFVTLASSVSSDSVCR